MKSARDPSAASGKALRRLIDGLIDAARRDVKRLSGSHEAVATHQLRVRMKKLLALLRLGRDCMPDHTFEAMRMHIRAVKNACADGTLPATRFGRAWAIPASAAAQWTPRPVGWRKGRARKA